MSQNVTPADPYSEIAAELHCIADDLVKLGPGHPAPRWFELNIQPHKASADDETIAHVDDVAVTLLGKPATTDPMPSGSYHHSASGSRGPVSVSVYQSVSSPELRELERLRAENAELRSAYGREVDNGDPAATVPAGLVGVAPSDSGPDRHTDPKDGE